MEASCYPQKLAASNQNEPAGGNELARRPAVNVIHQAVSGEGGATGLHRRWLHQGQKIRRMQL